MILYLNLFTPFFSFFAIIFLVEITFKYVCLQDFFKIHFTVLTFNIKHLILTNEFITVTIKLSFLRSLKWL